MSSPGGSMCMQECLARLHRKISRIAMSTAMTRACAALIALSSIAGVSDRLAAERDALRNIHRS
ncbi:hypothetical protein QA635_04590 [Bradyrhizobium brasilense]|uniref:hypothetical protein n=1 Tax=Bradyrhizobium brasilense TaxID=1419277 RepID=UPI0024B0F6A3|nr:hypothetical protein [Bradyrhizobium australafricanum]WFU33729.1 hypothetical protein QA635_04590 [Bradyrhizobium australafricanum]